ncbi:MAG: glycerophosphodiester phosphodiesterase [Thermoprotei archaeon]|nr:MAG: glycerophosphodiester phosphodiesterase [Thermoprotei archaeon]
MVLVIAHRGASAYEPENTVRSVLKAVEMGVDAVEVDVRLSRDGVPVVVHDEDLWRVARVKVKVRELSLSQLKRLDVGKGEAIPSLSEVIAAVKDRVGLVVELKEEGLEALVVDLLRGLGDVMVTSFIHRAVKRVKGYERSLKTGVIFTGLPIKVVDLALEADADALFPRRDFVTPEVVDSAHEHNLAVYPWTVDDPEEVVRLARMGVDGVVTNRPDVALEALRRVALRA